jgi:transcription elongation factor GreA-like protein
LQQIITTPENIQLRDELIENISSINSNYIDVYTGSLSPEQLIRGIQSELKKLGINDKSKFSAWISQDGFKSVNLPDSSVWILREGVNDETYIHIHPARNAINMTRIHGNSWKTAIIARVNNPHFTESDLSTINEVRVKKLNLSPVKNLTTCQRLLKAIRLVRIQ